MDSGPGRKRPVMPSIVRRYASLGADAVVAVKTWAEDVRHGQFPAAEESYHLSAEVAAAFGVPATLSDVLPAGALH